MLRIIVTKEKVIVTMQDEVVSFPDPPDSATSSVKSDKLPKEYTIYTRRWLVLGLYVLSTAFNGLMWLQYSVIADIIMDYYNIGSTWVDMTSLVFMISYVILVFPASWILDKYVMALFFKFHII